MVKWVSDLEKSDLDSYAMLLCKYFLHLSSCVVGELVNDETWRNSSHKKWRDLLKRGGGRLIRYHCSICSCDHRA